MRTYYYNVGFFSLIALVCMPAAAEDPAANIISTQGTAQFKEATPKDWSPAKAEQSLFSGYFVRTGEFSRMGLLFRDRTQVRLNEKTILQIKDATTQTRLHLNIGRAWTQTKTLPHKLYMETPSATAAIRGTDWDIEVDESGRTLITVLSGEIDFFNDFGRVIVRQNESAEAVIGKAPTKLILVRPRDRVQWVAAFAVEPLRHVSLSGRNLSELPLALEKSNNLSERGRILADLGRWTEAEATFREVLTRAPDDASANLGAGYAALYRGKTEEAQARFAKAATNSARDSELLALGQIALAILTEDLVRAVSDLTALIRGGKISQPASYLVLADLSLYSGELNKAIAYLKQGLDRFPDDARLYGALAQVHLAADERGKSREHINQALQRDAYSYEARLASGELARIEGDGRGASRAFDEAIALKPADDRGWFGRGRINTEKEEVRPGRTNLLRAIELNPHGLGYQGELGTLETFANNFAAARSAYSTALARKPDDYVALTGLGLLELKRGNTEAALNLFLRGSLMDPGYARVHVYTAVAYYQMGRTEAALEELTQASRLDDKDPLPHFMMSIIYNDLLRPSDAIAAARTALKLMPNLKSLNQIASNQRGTTNLGQAFAFIGMEEWAQNYAQESFNPFWAGSHLFLADRYRGLFTKNSELFQGFLADPMAFGNSNRNQTLLQKPGTYFTGSMRYSSASGLFHGGSPFVQVNGLENSALPFAYFLNQEQFKLKLNTGPSDLTYSTVALGLMPRQDIGMFVFANKNTDKSTFLGDFSGDAADLQTDRKTTNVDLGLHFKLSPQSQIWFKTARFTSAEDSAGILYVGAPEEAPVASQVKVRQPEYALRHTFALNEAHEITWGAERANRGTKSYFFSLPYPDLLRFSDFDYRETSLDVYFSDRWRVTPKLLLQGDLFYQRHRRAANYSTLPFFSGILEPSLIDSKTESFSHSKIYPRLGLAYQFADSALVRLAYQKWLRPAQLSSLGPVATVGIPLDDRLTQRGGEIARLRGQIEWEYSPTTFFTGHVDQKKIKHQPFSQNPFAVSDIETLNRLSSRELGSLAKGDLLEFELSPDYEAGRVRTAGVAVNHLLTPEWGVFARYIHTSSQNTGALFPGNKLPYLQQHAAAVGATWVAPSGWYFISRLVHRSQRFKNEANTEVLKAGLDGAFDLYWQSQDKRWLFRISADNAFDKNQPTQFTTEVSIRF